MEIEHGIFSRLAPHQIYMSLGLHSHCIKHQRFYLLVVDILSPLAQVSFVIDVLLYLLAHAPC